MQGTCDLPLDSVMVGRLFCIKDPGYDSSKVPLIGAKLLSVHKFLFHVSV
uniref:Uncharacterized protein n=1 Tax=Rhizophora mucronata TaxID=61149 RepID=A0A2P2NRP5_RHIMU